MLAEDDIRRVVHEAAQPVLRHTLEHLDLLVIALAVMVAFVALLLPSASGGLEPRSRGSVLAGTVAIRAGIASVAVSVLALGVLFVF